jgi:SIR2-like protein
MAKPGIQGSSIGTVLREKCSHTGWALCIGAGISVPAFPQWQELVERLVLKELGPSKGAATTAILLDKFSPDALIQAAHERSGKTATQFAKALSSELFRSLKHKLGPAQWKATRAALNAASPGDLKLSTWTTFRDSIRNAFQDMASLGIAEILVTIHGENLAPRSIISFNAESMLYALTHAEHAIGSSMQLSIGESPKRILDRVTHSVSHRQPDRIPYIYCHGLLPLVGGTGKLSPQSVDKLVFSEAEYLALANRNFSWQANVFTEAALFHSILFVGVSLTDPNMRRWLSWIHNNRTAELKTQHGYQGDSTVHFWINRRTASLETDSWIESTVAHLGVRVVWVTNWNEIPSVMKRMLGI